MADRASGPASLRLVPLVPLAAVPVVSAVMGLLALAATTAPSTTAPPAARAVDRPVALVATAGIDPFVAAGWRRAADLERAELTSRASRATPARVAPPPPSTAAARPAAPRVVLPLAGGYRLTARFAESGGRWHGNRHTGQDFAARWGTPVRAVAAGVVRSSGYRGSYGLRVEIRHADGAITTYSHLGSSGVRAGERVAAGERIGRVGTSGNTTGAHLHLEVLLGPDRFTDPLQWLRAHGARP